MRELTSFQRDLLVVTASLDDPSGVEVKRELEHGRDGSRPSSKVYSNFDDLVAKGLVAKGSHDGRTNAYSLTAEGVETLRSLYRWRESYLPADDVLAPESESRTGDTRRAVQSG